MYNKQIFIEGLENFIERNRHIHDKEDNEFLDDLLEKMRLENNVDRFLLLLVELTKIFGIATSIATHHNT